MGISGAALLAYAAAASAVVGAGVAIYSADQQSKAADRAADQAEADAAAARGAAMVQAGKIRKATRERQAEAVAALAASGVDVSTGTAEQIQQDIGQRGEEDALTTILNGKNRGRYLQGEAANDRYLGGQATTAGYINATNSVLSSVTASARGWKGGGTTPAWDMSNTNRSSGD